MNSALVDRIVNAVLYEGYLLYPYRPSTKNVKRWTFGGLYPRAWSEATGANERYSARARCLAVGPPSAKIEVEARLLHLIERSTFDHRDADTPAQTWQECRERKVALPACTIGDAWRSPCRQAFSLPAAQWNEEDQTPGRATTTVRRQEPVQGALQLMAEPMADDVTMLTLTILNETPLDSADASELNANQALLRSLASAHAILHVDGGRLISRVDPPAEYQGLFPFDAADGLWPVLVGEAGQCDTMLCSPIILYDYPEIAPESPGDYFDATEIDEMLALRVMTLSDEEKSEVERFDARGRNYCQRTQAMAGQQLAKLHGTMRSVRSVEDPLIGDCPNFRGRKRRVRKES